MTLHSPLKLKMQDSLSAFIMSHSICWSICFKAKSNSGTIQDIWEVTPYLKNCHNCTLWAGMMALVPREPIDVYDFKIRFSIPYGNSLTVWSGGPEVMVEELNSMQSPLSPPPQLMLRSWCSAGYQSSMFQWYSPLAAALNGAFLPMSQSDVLEGGRVPIHHAGVQGSGSLYR